MNGELEEKLYIHKDELDYPSFIPVPIELIKGDEFREVSASAKLLYGLLLSRTYIANKNGMIDEKGRIFSRKLFVEHNHIFYRVDEDQIKIVDIFNEKVDFINKLFGVKEEDR